MPESSDDVPEQSRMCMLLTIQTTKREEEHYSTQRQTQLSQQPARVGNTYLGTPTQAQPKNSGGKALVTSPQREVKIFTPPANTTTHTPQPPAPPTQLSNTPPALTW